MAARLQGAVVYPGGRALERATMPPARQCLAPAASPARVVGGYPVRSSGVVQGMAVKGVGRRPGTLALALAARRGAGARAVAVDRIQPPRAEAEDNSRDKVQTRAASTAADVVTTGPGKKRDWPTLQSRPKWTPTEDKPRPSKPKEPPSPEMVEAKALNKSIAEAANAEEILALFEREGHKYNTVNLCTTFHRLCKQVTGGAPKERAAVRADPRTARLVQTIEEQMHEFDTQALGNIAWAHGKLGHGSPGLIKRLAQAAVPRAHDFQPQEISTLLWAIGNDYDCSTSTDSRAWVRDVLEVFASEVTARIEHRDYNPRNLRATAWAFATCGFCDERLMNLMARDVIRSSPDLPTTTIANLAWSYGKLQVHAPSMFWAMTAELRRRGLEQLSPLDVSHLMWSMARLQFKDEELLAELARVTVRKLNQFNPQALANTTWAFARLGFYRAELFEAIEPHAMIALGRFNAQCLANVLWAFGAVRHDAPVLFDAGAKQAVRRIDEFSEVGLAGMANAYANAAHESSEFFDALEEAIEAKLDGMSARTLVNTAWALVVMKRVKPSLFSRMKAAAALKKEYSPSMLSQLFQVDLSLRYEAPALQPVSELNAKDGENADVDEYLELLWLAGNLRGKAARHWTRSKYNNTRIVSELQSDVSRTLTAMGVEHTCEYDDEEFAIDIVLPEHRIAIEVDGPMHYTVNTLRPVGATLLKRRLMRHLGWHVVPIPFFEYNTFAPLERKMVVLEDKLGPLLKSARKQQAARTSLAPSAPAATADPDPEPAPAVAAELDEGMQASLRGVDLMLRKRSGGVALDRSQLILQTAVTNSVREQKAEAASAGKAADADDERPRD